MARPLPMPGPGCWPPPTTTTNLPDRSRAARSLRAKSVGIGWSPRGRDGTFWTALDRVDHRGLQLRWYLRSGGLGVTVGGQREHLRAHRDAGTVAGTRVVVDDDPHVAAVT